MPARPPTHRPRAPPRRPQEDDEDGGSGGADDLGAGPGAGGAHNTGGELEGDGTDGGQPRGLAGEQRLPGHPARPPPLFQGAGAGAGGAAAAAATEDLVAQLHLSLQQAQGRHSEGQAKGGGDKLPGRLGALSGFGGLPGPSLFTGAQPGGGRGLQSELLAALPGARASRGGGELLAEEPRWSGPGGKRSGQVWSQEERERFVDCFRLAGRCAAPRCCCCCWAGRACTRCCWADRACTRCCQVRLARLRR